MADFGGKEIISAKYDAFESAAGGINAAAKLGGDVSSIFADIVKRFFLQNPSVHDALKKIKAEVVSSDSTVGGVSGVAKSTKTLHGKGR